MKQHFLIIILSISCLVGFSQPVKKSVKKPVSSTQTYVDKAMEEAMKDMNEEEKAEFKKMMGEAMKTADEMKSLPVKGASEGNSIPRIPVKQTALLQKIPLLQTQQQLSAYFTKLSTECKKNIPADIIRKVDQMINAQAANENEIASLPILIFLSKNRKAAVYAAVRVLQLKGGHPLVQNNSAFVLAQSGYPDKAVPVFKYLQQKYNTAELNNNLAQSYLSLGEKEEAKKYFRIGLAKNPQSSEMHCGLGLIFSEEGNVQEATLHIKASLEHGYSPIAEELAKKHKVKVKFSDVKIKAPEYFNPQKFKPAAPASVMEDIPGVQAEREAVIERHRNSHKKMEIFNAKYSASVNEKGMQSMLQQHLGYTGNTPFARKALYMVQLLSEERYEYIKSGMDMPAYKRKHDEYRKAFDNKFETIQKTAFDSEAGRCEAHVNNLNNFLQLSKENFENFERHALPKIYDLTNQSLYWQSILLSGDAYTAYFNGEVNEFYGSLIKFSELQNVYPTPEWIYNGCKNYKKELEKIKKEEILEKLECPVNIKFSTAPGSFKINCKTMEVEGGELLKLGFERDLKTGEFSLAFGLGLDINTGFINTGAKGQMFFKFGRDFMPIDMGLKGEAGIEAQLFIFTMDEKLTGTMGISSINVDAVHLGKETNLFNVDATK